MSEKQYIEMGVNFSELVRNTLGPFGLNNLVITGDGPIHTNDGATLIKAVDAKDPVSLMFKNLANSQEKHAGDGTTTCTIFCGELLRQALKLLNQNMHKIHIIKGYDLAKQISLNYLLLNQLEADKKSVMMTTFGSKISQAFADKLIGLIIDLELEKLKIYKTEGYPEDSEVINGYAFSGYTDNELMPTEIEGNIAVMHMRTNLESAKMAVQTSDELIKVNRQFRQFKKDIVDKLKELKVKAFIYTDTNPELQALLTEAGIMGITCQRFDELDKICLTTGAKVISDPEANFKPYLGFGKVQFTKDPNTIWVRSEDSKIKTLVLKAQTLELREEAARAIEDVIGVLRVLKKVVIGAGAIEVSIANFLREQANQISGKEQIVVLAYADALETIPIILAQNAGLDALEVLTKLRMAHKAGNISMGVDEDGISDALKRGILEPTIVKAHVINSGTDVANLIIKLDKILKGVDNATSPGS